MALGAPKRNVVHVSPAFFACGDTNGEITNPVDIFARQRALRFIEERRAFPDDDTRLSSVALGQVDGNGERVDPIGEPAERFLLYESPF
jgi:hypothetical protein